SRHQPKLVVDGNEFTVAFSSHAIHRACERISCTWPSYSGLGDIFAFFSQCLDFERCDLYPNALGFTFFDQCHKGTFLYSVAQTLMGERFVPGSKYGFRLGYCPAVIESSFIKAKTLLFPGYASTPEYGKIISAQLPWEKRQSMIEEVKELNAKKLLKPEG